MQPTPDRTDDAALVSLRRSDLAALVRGYQAAVHSRRQRLLVVLGLGALTLAAVLLRVGEHFGWPAASARVLLGAGSAILLGILVGVTMRARRARRQFAFQCPSCCAYLLGGPHAPVGTPRAELAIATGSCPVCGAPILEPDV